LIKGPLFVRRHRRDRLALHRFNEPGFCVIATLIGAYLGVLWLAAENLLAPITTHAVYDFVALVYFLRAHVRQHRAARIRD
jgi:hypothetical protein